MNNFDLAHELDFPELPRQLERVQHELQHVVAATAPAMQAPLQRIIGGSGKRLRPALVLAVVHGQAKPTTDAAIAAAVAVELVHVASLVHDDVIDKAAARRGVATINHQEGVGQAIVIGDYLLARAGAVAASISAEAARLIGDTIAALCEGQSRELADSNNLSRSADSLLAAIEGKTGALLAAACQLGGLCAGLSSKQNTALGSYGHAFGLGFQLVDDMLDYLADPKLLGKPVGNDLKEGVYTLPLIMSLQRGNTSRVQQIKQQDVAGLTAAMLADGSFAHSLQAAQAYNQQAAQALRRLQLPRLERLPAAYTAWALQALVSPRHQSIVSGLLEASLSVRAKDN